MFIKSGAAVVMVVLVYSLPEVHSWGHVFSQFSPRMLDSFGYGATGRHYQEPPPPSREEHEETKAACRGKKCLSNEQCCPHYLCIDRPGATAEAVSGVCMPHFEQQEGRSCSTHEDCGSSLECHHQNSVIGRCQPVEIGTQAYYESCRTSTDCNVVRGLCCQLLRQHRQAPRKACLYFNDPLMCIGHVPMNQVRAKVDYMTSEKRIIDRMEDYRNERK